MYAGRGRCPDGVFCQVCNEVEEEVQMATGYVVLSERDGWEEIHGGIAKVHPTEADANTEARHRADTEQGAMFVHKVVQVSMFRPRAPRV